MVQEVLRDAEGLPVRHYPASPGLSSTRVWGNPVGAWPLAGDDGGERRMWVGLDGLLVARLEGSSDEVAAMSDPLTGTLVLLDDELLDGASAWGTEVDAPVGRTESFVFAGMETLPGAPHKLAGHRLYDPDTGRFLSADPLGLDGGPHRFGYAEGEPTRLVDPVGLSAVGVMSSGVWQPPGTGDCGPRCFNSGSENLPAGNDKEFEKLDEDMAGANASNRPDMTSTDKAPDEKARTGGTVSSGGGVDSAFNESGERGLAAARAYFDRLEEFTSPDKLKNWMDQAKDEAGRRVDEAIEAGGDLANDIKSMTPETGLKGLEATLQPAMRPLRLAYTLPHRSPAYSFYQLAAGDRADQEEGKDHLTKHTMDFLEMATDITGQCFTDDALLPTPDGPQPIADAAPGDRVLTGLSAPVRACSRLRHACVAAVGALLAACSTSPVDPPGAGDEVLAYESRSGAWVEVHAAEVPEGAELLHEGQLFEQTATGPEWLGAPDVESLHLADAAFSEVDCHAEPSPEDWVLVLDPPRHAPLAEVDAGGNGVRSFQFQFPRHRPRLTLPAPTRSGPRPRRINHVRADLPLARFPAVHPSSLPDEGVDSSAGRDQRRGKASGSSSKEAGALLSSSKAKARLTRDARGPARPAARPAP